MPWYVQTWYFLHTYSDQHVRACFAASCRGDCAVLCCDALLCCARGTAVDIKRQHTRVVHATSTAALHRYSIQQGPRKQNVEKAASITMLYKMLDDMLPLANSVCLLLYRCRLVRTKEKAQQNTPQHATAQHRTARQGTAPHCTVRR